MERKEYAPSEDIWTLLERTKRGDRLAFQSIVVLYQQKVFRLAYSILRNKEDAMDIVQETFLRLYQKLGIIEKDRNFESWLLQVSKNLCIDHYRRRHKERELGSGKSLEDLNLASDEGRNSPASSDLREIFSRGINNLAERQRLVFVMKHYNGLQYREIAQVLDISVGTVKSLHFKAVQRLKGLLGPYLGIER